MTVSMCLEPHLRMDYSVVSTVMEMVGQIQSTTYRIIQSNTEMKMVMVLAMMQHLVIMMTAQIHLQMKQQIHKVAVFLNEILILMDFMMTRTGVSIRHLQVH